MLMGSTLLKREDGSPPCSKGHKGNSGFCGDFVFASAKNLGTIYAFGALLSKLSCVFWGADASRGSRNRGAILSDPGLGRGRIGTSGSGWWAPESPGEGAAPTEWVYGFGDEDPPRAGCVEVKSAQATRPCGTSDGTGEGTEATSGGETGVGGGVLGNEEGAGGQGEEVGDEAGGGWTQAGEAVWAIGNKKVPRMRDVVWRLPGTRWSGCATGENEAGKDEHVVSAEGVATDGGEEGGKRLAVEAIAGWEGQDGGRVAGPDEEGPLGDAGGKMGEEVDLDAQGRKGVLWAAVVEEASESDGEIFSCVCREEGRQSRTKNLGHDAIRQARGQRVLSWTSMAKALDGAEPPGKALVLAFLRPNTHVEVGEARQSGLFARGVTPDLELPDMAGEVPKSGAFRRP